MIIHGDAYDVLNKMDDKTVDLCFTSPSPGQPHLEDLFSEVYRVLRDTGSLYVQMGDYHDMDGVLPLVPERFAVNMMDNYGWHVPSKPIWVRTEKDDFQEDYNRYSRDWEYVLMFTKVSFGYYFNNPGKRSISSVWRHPYIEPRGFESGFPEQVIRNAIFRSCPPKGMVLDPLAGTGTTGLVAKQMGRNYILIDRDEELCAKMRKRLDER